MHCYFDHKSSVTHLRLTGSMASKKINLTVILFISFCCLLVFADNKEAETVNEEDIEKAEYAKGSLCTYCDYCKVSNDALTCHKNIRDFLKIS